MPNINNLRNELKFYKDKIENAMFMKSYNEAKSYIEYSVKLLQELNKYDTNAENKKTYAQHFNNLQKKYTICKENLGEKVPVSCDDVKQTPKKNNEKAVQRQPKNKSESKNESEEGIQYMFNDIDVRPYLGTESNEKVTFDDVIGMDNEKNLIKNEFFLSKEDIEFNERIGKKNKNFILLYGLPGTGKTYFAKSVSCELSEYFGGKVPFYSVICTNLKGKYQGETENRVIAIFEFAKQFDRCVIFMDEFESIALSRQKDINEVTASTVTTLLQMLDGFNSNKGLLLIAATNVPYNLDGAILSRVNAQVEVPLPSFDIIYPTLERKIGKFISEDVDLNGLAKKIAGYSNRDVKNLIDTILDVYSTEHRKNRDKSHEEFKITNEYIDRALLQSKSTIKKDEVLRLEEYKNSLI